VAEDVSEVKYSGVWIRVREPHLAALLKGAESEEVIVVEKGRAEAIAEAALSIERQPMPPLDPLPPDAPLLED
jgi:hypothetical protein